MRLIRGTTMSGRQITNHLGGFAGSYSAVASVTNRRIGSSLSGRDGSDIDVDI